MSVLSDVQAFISKNAKNPLAYVIVGAAIVIAVLYVIKWSPFEGPRDLSASMLEVHTARVDIPQDVKIEDHEKRIKQMEDSTKSMQNVEKVVNRIARKVGARPSYANGSDD